MIFRSPHPDVAVPDIALHRLVLERAAERGTKPAVIDGPSGRILTYAALTRGADRVAAALAARGFKKGDVLGLFTPNLPEFALVFHGTLAAGGVVTTINSLATEQDVEHQLRNAGARVAQLVLNVLLGGQGIDRRYDAARGERAVEDERELGEVGREQAQHVALLEAARRESRRNAIGPASERGVREDPAARPVDQRGLGAALGRPLEHQAMQSDVGHRDVGMRTPEDHGTRARLSPRGARVKCVAGQRARRGEPVITAPSRTACSVPSS